MVIISCSPNLGILIQSIACRCNLLGLPTSLSSLMSVDRRFLLCRSRRDFCDMTFEWFEQIFSCRFKNVFTGMGQSFSVSKLKELTPYTFRINAKNDAGDGIFSEPKTFYTKAQPPHTVKGNYFTLLAFLILWKWWSENCHITNWSQE